MAIRPKHVATALLLQVVMLLSVLVSAELNCEESQLDALRSQVQKALPFPVDLLCNLSCSPDLSHFNVTSVITFSDLASAEMNSSMTVGYCSHPEEVDIIFDSKREKLARVQKIALNLIIQMATAKILIDWIEKRKAPIDKLEKQQQEEEENEDCSAA